MDFQYLTPLLNVIGSVIFLALLKPRIEKWQATAVELDKTRQEYLAEAKELIDVTSSMGKRQLLGQLISLTVGVEREMVKRFYRLTQAFFFVAVTTIWLDFTALIFFQAEKYQWLFHVNAIVNTGIAFYLALRAHRLDEELSDFELGVVLSYCAKTHEELAKS